MGACWGLVGCLLPNVVLPQITLSFSLGFRVLVILRSWFQWILYFHTFTESSSPKPQGGAKQEVGGAVIQAPSKDLSALKLKGLRWFLAIHSNCIEDVYLLDGCIYGFRISCQDMKVLFMSAILIIRQNGGQNFNRIPTLS